jgi:signal transduction histidine kinase
MIPSTRRGVLLYVTEQGTLPAVFDAESDKILTRRPSTLDDAGDVPTADWTVVDAAALGSQPPSWLDGVAGDVYVLAPDDHDVPTWVRDAGFPTLDPSLLDVLVNAMAADDRRDTASVAADRHSNGVSGSRRRSEPVDDSSPTSDSDPDPIDRFDVLSAIPIPVALLDIDGVVRLVNRAWATFSADTVPPFLDCGVGANYLRVCDAEDDAHAASAVKTVRRVVDGDSDSGQIEYPSHGDSEERWFAMYVSRIADDGPFRAAVIHHDISQYRQHINVLDRVLRHNLRNKANIILGHAAALAGARDDETATAATTIGSAARELLSLSEQARRYREVSVDDRATSPIDVVSVVSEVTERLSRKHGEAVVETTLPSMAVVRASQSLSLVVHEVVENAIVHNDRDTPWVRVEVVHVHEGGDERVSIRVSDDGPGIPTEDRRLLTGGLEEHPIRHGSQLGVWVVSSLVTALGGTVAVEPRTPRGSVVTMTFPSASLADQQPSP